MLVKSPRRPSRRSGFEIAIICALPIEADAIDALFDNHWDDDGPAYDKANGDLNAYSTGSIGRHNVVLAHMPGIGIGNASIVASHCRWSFPNIKLAIITGVCGAVPYNPAGNQEIILGDVIISTGVIQYDLGQRRPDEFQRKDTLLDSLGRPNAEIRGLLQKLQGIRCRNELSTKIQKYLQVLRKEPELQAVSPGASKDWLFKSSYRHVQDGQLCDGHCSPDQLILRDRLNERADETPPAPKVHFGLVASGDTILKSAEHRDVVARRDGVLGFEMEGAGVWENFPCVVIKGACDYADSHKSKVWQRYAAATAAACTKAFLDQWVPSVVPLVATISSSSEGGEREREKPKQVQFLVPYPRNDNFVGRAAIMKRLQQLRHDTFSQIKLSLFGLGGAGKTQIAIEYAYWLRSNRPEMSIFWVHASNAERFRLSFADIARFCRIAGHDDPEVDVLTLVKHWLELEANGPWLMVVDNADDLDMFSERRALDDRGPLPQANTRSLLRFLPTCSHGSILVTTRNRQVGLRLTAMQQPIEVPRMDDDDSRQLLCAMIRDSTATDSDMAALSRRLENLPLALAQAAAYIQEASITISRYLPLMDKNREYFLCKEFNTIGRDSDIPQAVAQTWILSFDQIEQTSALAYKVLALMSLLDCNGIPESLLSHYCAASDGGGASTDMEIAEALGLLQAYSFVKEKDGIFQIHRLIQLVTRKWLADRETFGSFAESALRAVAQSYPYGVYKNWARCAQLLPHAHAVVKLEISTKRSEELKAELLYNMGSFLHFTGQLTEAENATRQTFRLTTKLRGHDHINTLHAMHSLSTLCRSQGKYVEATELQRRVLDISLKSQGRTHPFTLRSMSHLAATYLSQGNLEKAEQLSTEALEIGTSCLKPGDPHLYGIMDKLALVYYKQARWLEAESMNLRVGGHFRQKLTLDDPHTLRNKAQLAMIYSHQDRMLYSLRLANDVLATQRLKLGDDHPDTILSMHNLATLYNKLQRYREAAEMEAEALRVEKAKYGMSHRVTLSTMISLADIYHQQGLYSDEEQLRIQVRDGFEVLHGSNHPDTLAAAGRLEVMDAAQSGYKSVNDDAGRRDHSVPRSIARGSPITLAEVGHLSASSGVTKKREVLDQELH